MRVRQYGSVPGSDNRVVQLMIRHPNYSGMQMDQVTRLYVPAHFVSTVKIWQGDDLLLAIESGFQFRRTRSFVSITAPMARPSFGRRLRTMRVNPSGVFVVSRTRLTG